MRLKNTARGRRGRRARRSRSPAAQPAVGTRDAPGRRRLAHDRQARRRDRHRDQQPVDRRLVGAQARLRNAIFEPLAFVNLDRRERVTPWLASKIEWDDDYTSSRSPPRDGVKWSDGEDFTADDIAFTFNLIATTPRSTPAASASTTSTVDGDKVTLSFDESKFVKQGKVLQKSHRSRAHLEGRRRPDHRDQPRARRHRPVHAHELQLAERAARSRATTTGAASSPCRRCTTSRTTTTPALTTALANGDADWAQGFIPDIEDATVDKDPSTTCSGRRRPRRRHDCWFNTTNEAVQQRRVPPGREHGRRPRRSTPRSPARAASRADLGHRPADPGRRPVHRARVPGRGVHGRRRRRQGDPRPTPATPGTATTLDRPVRRAGLLHAAGPAGLERLRHGHHADRDAGQGDLGVDAKVDTPDADTWWANKGTGDFEAILHWTDTGLNPWRHLRRRHGRRYLDCRSASSRSSTTSDATTTRR